MKLEVGMYMRYESLDGNYPIIQRITKLEIPGRCGGKYKVFTDKCGYWYIDSDYIEIENVKVSHNLIDLIEVGDYVNGKNVFSIKNSDGYSIYVEPITELFEKDIQTILTKEQFKANEYVVE